MTDFRSAAVAAAILTAVAAPAWAQSTNVDMDRFDGRWFEVVRNPNNVQKDCSRAQIDFNGAGAADRYRIRVTCTRRADGEVEVLNANARVTAPGRFRFTLAGILSFGGLAGQNYVVMDHAPDYSWSILALPNKSNWWIWHRSQTPSAAVRAQLITRARDLGLRGEPVHTGR